MPNYLVRVTFSKSYEVLIDAPDDTAIFEYKERPDRLSSDALLKLTSADLFGELVDRSYEVTEVIEGV